jgi:PAS domain S-box-containing protein
MPGAEGAAAARTPLLARLRVSTKLMLLVMLPVCVLVGFTAATSVNDWTTAGQLQGFQSATRLSVTTAGLADRLAAERTAAVLLRVRPGAPAQARLAGAQHQVNVALRQAVQRVGGWGGTVDVAGRFQAARRQLGALRLQAAARSLTAQQVSQSYNIIVADLINTAGALVAGPPTPSSGRAADAYLDIIQAIEAAQRERADVAAVLGTREPGLAQAASRWSTLEGAQLDAFRRNASGRLAAALEAVLFSPAGITVQGVRNAFLTSPRAAVAHTSQATWLAASGARIGGLRSLAHGAAGDLAATASRDLGGARVGGIRDLSLSLAVLAVVVGLALALARSITRPLKEASEGARTLSSGDLSFDISYAGRDEIGDVATAFRDLRVTVERLVGEIRATNAAISASQLDHRADAGAFRGTWSQLLAGMNDTTAAFARVHGRRRRAERELEGIFNLSLDLLCISGTDGYFKRVNPAVERTLGYTSEELLSRPIACFVHPDDRGRTLQAEQSLAVGQDVVKFENRYICRDGTERRLEWSARPVPEEGLSYAAARDVTDTRRASEEQTALRRVATLVARGTAPLAVFDAVVAEMHLLLRADNTRLLRYEPDGAATVIAARSEQGMAIPVGARQTLTGQSVSASVWHSGGAARLDSFAGPPGSIAAQLRRLGVRSAAGAPIIVEGHLWGVMVAAWRRHRPESGIEGRIAQFTELVGTAISNAQARTDLAASRARVVAASDQTRRRIERDLHDGAQQRLVSLGLGLRAAREAIPPGHSGLQLELGLVESGIAEVLDELREMSRGIHPAILSEGGLRPALKALARRSAVPVRLELGIDARLPEPVEVAAYFVVSEALTNVTKHARASAATVRAGRDDRILTIVIGDDGSGGADPAGGSGLIGLADRVESLGGTIDVSSPPGAGTRILVRLPIDAG